MTGQFDFLSNDVLHKEHILPHLILKSAPLAEQNVMWYNGSEGGKSNGKKACTHSGGVGM